MGLMNTILGKRDASRGSGNSFSNGFGKPLEERLSKEGALALKELMLRDMDSAYAKLLESPDNVAYAEHLMGDEMVRGESAKLLVRYYVEQNDGKKIDAMLTHSLTVIRAAASWHLSEVSESKDMEFALPAIGNALSDPNEEIQQRITRALLNAASNEKTREKAVTLLASALSSDALNVKANAAKTLADAAEQGIDITAAIRALGHSLTDAGSESARALVNAAKNDKTRDDAVSVLRNALSDKKARVKLLVSKALCDAADKGVDVSLAIPALGNALYDADDEIRKAASAALKFAAGNRTHISSAIPMLEHALSDRNEEARNNASEALGYAVENEKTSEMAIEYLTNALSNKKKSARELAASALRNAVENEKTRDIGISAFAKALHDKNKDVGVVASQALSDAAEGGIDISAALPDVTEAMRSGGNRLIRINSACAIGFASSCQTDVTSSIEALGVALDDRDGDVRLASSWALAQAAGKGISTAPALARLSDAIGDKDSEVRVNAANAFVGAIENERTRETAASLLGKKVSEAKERIPAKEMAAWALLDSACKGLDITPAQADLGIALTGRGHALRYNAALAILTSAERGYDISPLARQLGNAAAGKDRDVALKSAMALLAAAEKKQAVADAREPLQSAVDDRNPEMRAVVKKILLIIEGPGDGS